MLLTNRLRRLLSQLSALLETKKTKKTRCKSESQNCLQPVRPGLSSLKMTTCLYRLVPFCFGFLAQSVSTESKKLIIRGSEAQLVGGAEGKCVYRHAGICPRLSSSHGRNICNLFSNEQGVFKKHIQVRTKSLLSPDNEGEM